MPSRVFAGGGSISNGRLDLHVLFLYAEPDVNNWKPLFDEASALLYNATEGRLQIGKVYFHVGCNSAKDQADIWIDAGADGAAANRDGLGRRGWRILLTNAHKSTTPPVLGQIALVHEIGHYVFNLGDEYGGCVEQNVNGTYVPLLSPGCRIYEWCNSEVTVLNGGGEAFYCTAPAGDCATNCSSHPSAGCIMAAGARCTCLFGRSEFCGPLNHVGSRAAQVLVPTITGVLNVRLSTDQECANHTDCWNMIAAKLNTPLPPMPPLTTDPGGRGPVQFVDLGDVSRFELCLDTSGSMASASKIDLAKTASRCLVSNGRLRNSGGASATGDEIGVVEFNTGASIVSPIRELVTEADKTSIKNAITLLSAAGSTSMGEGLRTSLNELVNRGPASCSEVIILLSDGMHNTGDDPSDVVPDVADRGAVVYTIALGADADLMTLSDIALGTGGRSYYADDATDLPTIFEEIRATATGADLLDREELTISANSPVTRNIRLDAYCDVAYFTFTGANALIELTSPTGETSSSLNLAPNVTYMSDSIVQVFKVTSPAAGVWKVKMTRNQPGVGTLNWLATSESNELRSPRLQFEATPFVNLAADPNARIKLSAVLAEGASIINAHVTADVHRPDDTVATIRLFDDGNPAMGDRVAGDGEYSAQFSGYSGSGAYTFIVRADTSGAMLLGGEDTQAAATSRAATAAQRIASASATVNGASPNHAPTAVAEFAGPFQCDGEFITIPVSAVNSTDADSDTLHYVWTSSCPGATFTNVVNAAPKLRIVSGAEAVGSCSVTVDVNDGVSHSTATLVINFSLTDIDGDGASDLCDQCPDDSNKSLPGACGCGQADEDSDGDGVEDCHDDCPDNPNKTKGGICGCEDGDFDSDGDGLADCSDGCPSDRNKIEPGFCGCGVPETDDDNDGTPNCEDGCPHDPSTTLAEECDCGGDTTDTDGDGIFDCIDNCPNITNRGQEDGDGDGVGDACTPPPGGQNVDTCGLCGAGSAPLMALMAMMMLALRRRLRRGARGR